MGNSTSAQAAAAVGEETPLLLDNPKDADGGRNMINFRRASRRASKSGSASTVAFDKRSSVRIGTIFAGLTDDSEQSKNASHQNLLRPIDALGPLVAGGVIVATDGYKTAPHPPSSVKSLPAFAPFPRMARHRSFALWWLNEFRHWWKSSRLLVRLAGLWTLAVTAIYMAKMVRVFPGPFKHHKHKLMQKNAHRAYKIVKKLGQGGPMKYFLNFVHPFTRSLRIIVGAWRWIEAAQCRRGEVGTEEFMAFIGNRVSRLVARTFVDSMVLFVIMPSTWYVFQKEWLSPDAWHPITLFIILGILRAVAPYAASFQGSRIARILTRSFFKAYLHRWRPIQHVDELNLLSDDCIEKDEVSQTADLARLAKLVAKALGAAQQIGVDGMDGTREALEKEGFLQIGAGSGGYALYECHRRVFSRQTADEGESMTMLLHVTPYGPSILDVMPRYVVLEFEDSVDRRNKWSEFISKQVIEGPPVVEGYCYNGAFFSPHHFAEMKLMYDKQLLTYDMACKAMCKPQTGRSPNPPSDLLTLKAFLVDGKPSWVKRKNRREEAELQGGVAKVTRELKSMMALNKGPDACCAPRGVILYFEGLDCAGKSSTGGLVEQALRDAGFSVEMRQYNVPPTAEEKLRPWMDRFETPDSSGTVALAVGDGNGEDETAATMKMLEKCVEHNHAGLVWDRGPAGDFVYNPEFRAMGQDERREKYREFMEFDRWCFENRILFLKLLFVTNRDSIASTLGKRLAQKHMAQDLDTWLKSSRGGESDYGSIGFEGLDEIKLHIDPTDFIAFNNYQTNLRIFTNFALNTDLQENPWVVVNTTDRYNARKQLLHAFRVKLERFKTYHGCCPKMGGKEGPLDDTPAISEKEQLAKGFRKPLPIQLLVSLIGLLLLLFIYGEHTTFGEAFKDTYIPGAAYFDEHGKLMTELIENTTAVMDQKNGV